MVLMNFAIFVVFKILLNLVSMQSLLNTNNSDMSEIWKTVQRDLIFIFDVVLVSAIGFVSFLVSSVENVVSFI